MKGSKIRKWCSSGHLVRAAFLLLWLDGTLSALLKVGNPLVWHSALPHLLHVRQSGVEQFINNYNRVKDIKEDDLKWGDEIEFGVFRLDHAKKRATLALRAKEIIEHLNKKEQQHLHQYQGCNWLPEYGGWMVESTPRDPYSGYSSDLLAVQGNMRLRRKRLLTALKDGEVAPTMSGFPLMGVLLPREGGGVEGFTTPACSNYDGPIAASKVIPDGLINPHPRFGALTRNIRLRRGRNVDIRVPLYQDHHTPEFQHQADEKAAGPGLSLERPTIDMDAMAFGMGMCCVQLTFQQRNLCESRYMYDQLAVLTPIMLALSAATPIFKGRLADTDVRWQTISSAVDDRTRAELGDLGGPQSLDQDQDQDQDPRMAGGGTVRQPKSRYDSISCFIYQCQNEPTIPSKYNDIPCPIDQDSKARLLEAGVDEALAHHVAHLFTRDPLVIFEDAIHLDNSSSTEHFENLQSTNWQTMRWKPPPPKKAEGSAPHIGWRVEFRSMEVQMTDFENAAFVTFVVLLNRVILAFDLNLYIPLSKVDENMKRAHARDAVLNQKFYFRKNIAPPQEQHSADSYPCHEPIPCVSDEDNEFEEMTIGEIMNGKGDYFPGLIPLVYAYLDHIHCDAATRHKMQRYLGYLRKRSMGELQTTASYLRDFVLRHDEYRHDSVVSERIAYDLITKVKNIGEGVESCPEVLGHEQIRKLVEGSGWDDGQTLLTGGRINTSERSELLKEITNRKQFQE